MAWKTDYFGFRAYSDELQRILEDLIIGTEYVLQEDILNKTIYFITRGDNNYVLEFPCPSEYDIIIYENRPYSIKIRATDKKIVEDEMQRARIIVDTRTRVARQFAETGDRIK